MQSVSGLMSGYFSNSDSKVLVERSLLPVKITKNEWVILKDPERMHRVYDFKGRPIALKFFVEELLDYQEKLGHHSEITISAKEVKVEVYTHGVQRITNLDKELARESDSIYNDSKEI
jgi:pterin-4a-carbinolamine dehydratase